MTFISKILYGRQILYQYGPVQVKVVILFCIVIVIISKDVNAFVRWLKLIPALYFGYTPILYPAFIRDILFKRILMIPTCLLHHILQRGW